MKAILLIVVSMMMVSQGAFAFDQQALDNIQNLEQLMDSDEIIFDGMSDSKLADIDEFFQARRFRCVAENRRGARYRAQANDRRKARRRAMRKCRRDSFRPRSCYIVRCRRTGGGQFWDLVDLIDGLKN